MKVILLQDVKNVGKKGNVIEAADGYARNFLFPRKLAVEANKGTIGDLEQKKQAEAHRKQQEKDAALALAGVLKESGISISVKTGDNGKLFGSVTNKEIAQAMQDQHNITLDKKKIEMAEPLKTVGTHQVIIRLYPGVNADVSVNIKGIK